MPQISRLQSLDTDQVRDSLTQDVDVGKKPFLRWDGLHWLLHNQHGEPSAIVSAYTVAEMRDAGEIEERPGPVECAIIWVAKEKPKPVTHTPEPWAFYKFPWVKRHDEDQEMRKSLSQADFAHAAACVDALAGINPEAIKPLLEAAQECREAWLDSAVPAVSPLSSPISHLRKALNLTGKVKPC